MASYPSYTQGLDSRVTYDDGRRVDRTEGGALKLRAMYSAKKATYHIVHPYLSNAERDALLSFFDTNRFLAVDLTWRGDTTPVAVSCKFLEAPKIVPLGRGKWRAEVMLGQV